MRNYSNFFWDLDPAQFSPGQRDTISNHKRRLGIKGHTHTHVCTCPHEGDTHSVLGKVTAHELPQFKALLTDKKMPGVSEPAPGKGHSTVCYDCTNFRRKGSRGPAELCRARRAFRSLLTAHKLRLCFVGPSLECCMLDRFPTRQANTSLWHYIPTLFLLFIWKPGLCKFPTITWNLQISCLSLQSS